MTVYTYQKYQEKVEAAANMLCQLKQRDQLNKGHDKIKNQTWRKFCMCLATLFYNLWVLILIFLMESQKWGHKLFWERLSASINALKICQSIPTQNQSMATFLQYWLLTPMNIYQELQETKAGLTKFFSIHQVERSKIRWPWHNTCQSICLRNMNMKQFLPLLNVGCLLEIPWSHNNFLQLLMMPI